MENLVVQKPECIIIYARTNDITSGINSLNSAKKIVKKCKENFPKHKTFLLQYITQER